MAKNFIIEGRLVKGHPLVRREVTDEVTKRPVLNQDGTHKTNIYVAIAIPKNGNPDIWSTPFGLAMYEEAVSGWPNREWQAPTFAWKFTDGDSLVPNTVGKVPASQEGYPGHWIIHCKTEFTIKCYYPGKYDPMYQIVDAQAIKTGDYCRVSVTCRANNPSKKPGLYMNPELFELSGVGAAIYSGPDPNQAFGGTSATLPAGVPAAGGMPGMPPAGMPGMPPAGMPGMPPAPAHDFVDPTLNESFRIGSATYTRAQLQGWGWTEAQIIAYPRA